MTHATTPTTDHRARADGISQAALVRRHLGQGAICRRSGGRWAVTFRGRVFEADDLLEAIRLALGREAKAR